MGAPDNRIELIKRLREDTGFGFVETKKALEEAAWDTSRAFDLLISRGGRGGRSGRDASAGLIETYNHNSRIGVVVEVRCESDFVARTAGFAGLCRELAMQIAASDPQSVPDLLAAEYMRDATRSVADLIDDQARRCGENILVARFARFTLGGGTQGEPSHLGSPRPSVPAEGEEVAKGAAAVPLSVV